MKFRVNVMSYNEITRVSYSDEGFFDFASQSSQHAIINHGYINNINKYAKGV